MKKIYKKMIVLLLFLSLMCMPFVTIKAEPEPNYDYETSENIVKEETNNNFDSITTNIPKNKVTNKISGFKIIKYIILLIILFFAEMLFDFIFDFTGFALSTGFYTLKRKMMHPKKFKNSKILCEKEILEIDPTINEEQLIETTFNLNKNIEQAKMNYDYELLKEILSEELFNEYKSQLEELKNKNEKHIIEGINYKNGYVKNIEKKENSEIIDIFLTIKEKKYIVDLNNNIIKGNKNEITITYLITLERIIDKHCPLCGTELDGALYCQKCESLRIKNTSKYIMIKKIKM